MDRTLDFAGPSPTPKFVTFFELLGRSLQNLINEAESKKSKGFSIDVVKLVAKDILSALKVFHSIKYNGENIVHSDIKPDNIAMTLSKKHLYANLEDLVNGKEEGSLEHLRMSCQKKKKPFDKYEESKIKRQMKKYLEEVADSEKVDDVDGPKFKLIDLGRTFVSLL